MKQQRLNFQKQLDHPSFKVKIATVNKKIPTVIYFKGGTFITPIIDRESYGNDIHGFEKCFKTLVKDNIELRFGDYLADRFICHLHVKDKSVKYNDSSYLSIECHLRQKNDENLLSLVDMKKLLETSIYNTLEQLCEMIIEHGYIINKNKTKI